MTFAQAAVLLCSAGIGHAKISIFEPRDWHTVDFDARPRGPAADEPRGEALRDWRRAAGEEAAALSNSSVLSGRRQMWPEFAPMKSVLVAYPLGLPASLVAAFSHDLPTVVLCVSGNQAAASSTFRAAGAAMENISFLDIKTDSYWTRDFGPWWVQDEQGELAIVDFTYNRPRANDNRVSAAIAQEWSLPYEFSGLTLTGGNNMVDGTQVGAASYLVYEENDCGSQPCDTVNDKMEASYGIADFQTVADPTGNYIEHIDCWGKFVSDDKIIVDQVEDSSRHYAAYEQVAQHYAQLTNSKGARWQVYRTKITDGAPQAYSNSLLLNKKAYVPVTGGLYSEADAAALQVYQEALPDYDIVGVVGAFGAGWENTDALHCRTHGMPVAPPSTTLPGALV